MLTALFDTSVVLDYLLGVDGARRAFAKHAHRAISVITWVEVMNVAPPEQTEATRLFLQSCERLSVSEAIADRALLLMQADTELSLARALTWSTAQVNGLLFITTNTRGVDIRETAVWVPYKR